MCVCVCVCVREKESKREQREGERQGEGKSGTTTVYLGVGKDDSASGLVNSVDSPLGLAFGNSGFCGSSSEAIIAFRKGSKIKLASFKKDI